MHGHRPIPTENKWEDTLWFKLVMHEKYKKVLRTMGDQKNRNLHLFLGM